MYWNRIICTHYNASRVHIAELRQLRLSWRGIFYYFARCTSYIYLVLSDVHLQFF